MTTQQPIKIKDKLTKVQAFWFEGVIKTLTSLDLISDVLLSENDKGIVITMVPKFVFKDMLKEGDDPLTLGLSIQMPVINDNTQILELTNIQYSFLRQFVHVLLSYGRELAAVNNTENSDTHDNEDTQQETDASGSGMAKESGPKIFELPTNIKTDGSQT